MTDSIESYYNSLERRDHDSALANVVYIMENDSALKGLYKFNEFSYEVEHTGPVGWSKNIREGMAVTDNDICELLVYMAKRYNFSPAIQRVEQSVQAISLRKKYNPIKDYLESLTWDGQSRLNDWLIEIAGATTNLYTRAVGQKVLVGAVKRIYEPGCQFDYMMILEGGEGIGKTTMLKILADKWYSTLSFSMQNKDIIDQMRGKWLFEIEEMHGFDRAERNRVKATITRTTDRCRLSFRRRAQDFPRNCILIGTMNPEGENKYLDDAENRRFWPVALSGKVKLDLLLEIRDQLWAEACFLYKQW